MVVLKNKFDLDELIKGDNVLVDFYADWCGPCKAIEPIIDTLESEVEGLQVVKVDTDRFMSLARDYHIITVPNLKLFREGRAAELDKNITVPLRPMDVFITYVDKKRKFDRENGLCNIGPLVTIGTNGNITECDASIDHQNTIYNYGNVLNESIEENVLRRGKLFTNPKRFEKKAAKVITKYSTYEK